MKTRSRKNMLHSALMLLAVMALIFVPFKASAEDAGIKVFMTVSNKGAIVSTNDGEAMAWKEVTVLDLDENGDYSFDEALAAAHKAYNSEAGYSVSESSGMVNKLWGIDGSDTLFFINGEGLPTGVKADNVKEGDYLTASTLADGKTYGDWIAKFDKYEIKAATGEAVSLNVTGHLGMAYEEADKVFVPLKDIEVGVWKNGALDSVMGKTDEAGNVSLTFDEPGTYVVTGKGTAKGTVTDYSAMTQDDLGMDIGLPEGTYFKYDESFDSSFGVGYTEEDLGVGPYPMEKVTWIDWMDWNGDTEFAGYLIKARVNELMEAKFVYYFTQTNCYDEWKKQIFIQSTIQNIGADRYSQLQLPIPPLAEQQAIADYLDKKCGEIDELITIKQQKIESLKEYKKSVIYEYVTGKREV